MKTFFVRTITATLIAGISLSAFIFLPPAGITILISILTAALIWEYTRLIFYQKNEKRLRVSLFFLCSLFYVLCIWILTAKIPLIEGMIFVVLTFMVASFWIFQSQTPANIVKNMGASLIALCYLVCPSVLFLQVFLYEKQGPAYLIWILCVVFTGDIFAYLFGSILNGKKWMAHISPRKTYSGLIFGLLSAGFVSAAISIYLNKQLILTTNKPIFFFILGILCFLVAQTGDLLVSTFKRQANVKDTGSLLPGHGGLLDRLDGVLLALPFMYSILVLLKFSTS